MEGVIDSWRSKKSLTSLELRTCTGSCPYTFYWSTFFAAGPHTGRMTGAHGDETQSKTINAECTEGDQEAS